LSTFTVVAVVETDDPASFRAKSGKTLSKGFSPKCRLPTGKPEVNCKTTINEHKEKTSTVRYLRQVVTSGSGNAVTLPKVKDNVHKTQLSVYKHIT
jgi:hypothetical protein